jgi:uncharacterized caspase-like protein
MRRFAWVALALVFLMLAAVPAAHAEKRVALVIGNAAYAHASTLSSPPMDADAMEAAFKRMKFDVVVRLKDLGVKPLADALSAFRREATGADMAVIYYSGHGIEIEGVNYLVPIDAKLDDHFDAPLQAIRLPDVLRQLDGSRRLRVVILDACRDNPFQQRLAQLPDRKSISVGKGFAAVREADLGQRTLVAFAAREGTTAEDRRGRLSTYTDALLKHIEKPDLEIGLLFRQVRDDVYRETKGRQQPQEYGSLGGEALYLSAPPPAVPAAPTPAASQIRLSEAAEAWDRIKDSTSIALLQRFIARYKDTFYAEMAQARVEELKKQQVAVAAPPAPPPSTPQPTPPFGTQQSILNNFQIHEGTEVTGNHAGFTSVLTLEQCRDDCGRTAKCRAFAFRRTDGGCFWYESGKLQANSNFTSGVTTSGLVDIASSSDNSLSTRREKVDLGQFQIREGTEVTGNHAGFTSVLTLEQCRDNCSRTAKCRAFAFRRTDGGCFWYESGKLQANSNFTSGVR